MTGSVINAILGAVGGLAVLYALAMLVCGWQGALLANRRASAEIASLRTLQEEALAHAPRLSVGPERVQQAPDLDGLISPAPRSDLPETAALREEIDNWRSAARRTRRSAGGRAPGGEGAGNPVVLHDFQEDYLKFALAMRDAGLPAGQP